MVLATNVEIWSYISAIEMQRSGQIVEIFKSGNKHGPKHEGFSKIHAVEGPLWPLSAMICPRGQKVHKIKSIRPPKSVFLLFWTMIQVP